MSELDLNRVAVPFEWPEIFGRTAPVSVDVSEMIAQRIELEGGAFGVARGDPIRFQIDR